MDSTPREIPFKVFRDHINLKVYVVISCDVINWCRVVEKSENFIWVKNMGLDLKNLAIMLFISTCF